MEVYIVRWTYKADNYPYLQVFATEKLAEDAKWYGDNDPRNVSKRIEKQEVIGLNTQKTDNFDLKEYLAEGRLTNEGIFSRKKEPSISDKFYGGMDKEDYKRLSNENSDLYAQLKEKYANNPQQLADDMYEALSGNASSEKELNAAFKSML